MCSAFQLCLDFHQAFQGKDTKAYGSNFRRHRPIIWQICYGRTQGFIEQSFDTFPIWIEIRKKVYILLDQILYYNN